jgi:hypothetical protein
MKINQTKLIFFKYNLFLSSDVIQVKWYSFFWWCLENKQRYMVTGILCKNKIMVFNAIFHNI